MNWQFRQLNRPTQETTQVGRRQSNDKLGFFSRKGAKAPSDTPEACLPEQMREF